MVNNLEIIKKMEKANKIGGNKDEYQLAKWFIKLFNSINVHICTKEDLYKLNNRYDLYLTDEDIEKHHHKMFKDIYIIQREEVIHDLVWEIEIKDKKDLICYECGNTNPKEYKYCTSCGTKLREYMGGELIIDYKPFWLSNILSPLMCKK